MVPAAASAEVRTVGSTMAEVANCGDLDAAADWSPWARRG